MEARPDHQPDSCSSDTTLPNERPNNIGEITWNNTTGYLKILNNGRPGIVLISKKTKSADVVRREASSKSDSIYISHETLHGILQRHEATIQKRWFKKTRQQRLMILLDAWPNMPAFHRPDFGIFRKEAGVDCARSAKYRDCFIWPYINQEDLLKKKVLLLFLKSRGRHSPSQFAAWDFDAMRLGVTSSAIEIVSIDQYVMLLHGMSENSRDYGKPISCNDHPDAFKWATTRKQFFPEGLLVLEAQARLLDFLVKCCLQLLKDNPKSTLIGDSFSILPDPQLKTEDVCLEQEVKSMLRR